MYELIIETENINANKYDFNLFLESYSYNSIVYNDNNAVTITFSEEPIQSVKDEIINKYNAYLPGDLDNVTAKEYTDKLKLMYAYLMNRALSSSMEKEGDDEYLKKQREEYEYKYQVAKGELISSYWSDIINEEMINDFPESLLDQILTELGITINPIWSQLDKMNQLIIGKYELGEQKYHLFTAFCSGFRTHVLTFIANKDWAKVLQAFEIVENLPKEINIIEAQTIYTDFKTALGIT